jgi:hypothetical protein
MHLDLDRATTSPGFLVTGGLAEALHVINSVATVGVQSDKVDCCSSTRVAPAINRATASAECGCECPILLEGGDPASE